MSRIRVSRVQEQIKKELSQIVQSEIKDPRLGFVTITGVEMSTDLKTAKVYVSIFGDQDKRDSSLLCLEKAKGFIRSEVGRRVHLRHIPEITFMIDTTLDYSEQISKLIEDVSQEQKDE